MRSIKWIETPFPMTLNEKVVPFESLGTVFKVTTLFDAKYLTNDYSTTTIVTIEGE